MQQPSDIENIFISFLSELTFDESQLDYTCIAGHIDKLKFISEVSNSGVHVFDLNKKTSIFYSSNFGKLLGYEPIDYEGQNYTFFDQRIHPDERQQMALNGISLLKIFNAFSVADKLNHKVIDEYRILNADNKYVRVIEQYQVLELAKNGQIWLMLSIVDISPNQEENGTGRCQLFNFRTGNFVQIELPQKAELTLTKRELEILKLVKDGLLSKEISSKLSISLHTVNTHRQRVLDKLEANNSLEAVVFATKLGILE